MASTSGTGVGAVLDEAVNLPAAATNCSNTGTCPQQRVHAHSAITGSKGNTLYHFDYGSCSPSSNSCYSATDDTPFTGGAGAQSYTFVQQSDIDGATQALQQASAPNAQQVLQGQLKANESWIGTQACKPQKTAANHVANDKAANVTVTITLTCTGEVYDQNGALASAKQMLQDQAASNPGNNYALAGAINATLLNAQLAGTNGTVGVTVDVKGTWIFQLSAAQKQDLARMLAGKKKVAAVDLLQQQKGIKQAQIQLTGGDQDTLPDNPQVIAITIQPGA